MSASVPGHRRQTHSSDNGTPLPVNGAAAPASPPKFVRCTEVGSGGLEVYRDASCAAGQLESYMASVHCAARPAAVARELLRFVPPGMWPFTRCEVLQAAAAGWPLLLRATLPAPVRAC